MKRLAILGFVLVAWAALAICVDQARALDLDCTWTSRTGIASHVGSNYPWRETAALRKSWGELPPNFDLNSVNPARSVALHEAYDRRLIGRWIYIESASGAEWAQVLDSMGATLPVADLDPLLLMTLNNGLMRQGLPVTVWIPSC